MTTLTIVDGRRPGESHNQSIVRRLKGELAQHNLTPTGASRIFGKPQAWISRRITGSVPFDPDELEAFCVAVGLDFYYVLTGARVLPPIGDTGLLLPRVDSNHQPSGDSIDLALAAAAS